MTCVEDLDLDLIGSEIFLGRLFPNLVAKNHLPAARWERCLASAAAAAAAAHPAARRYSSLQQRRNN